MVKLGMDVTMQQNNTSADTTRDLQKGQVSTLAPDKIPFSQFARTKNMRPIDGDLRLRYGTTNKGAVSDGAAEPVDYNAITIGKYKTESGDVLVQQVKDGENSKIVLVDTDTMIGDDRMDLVGQSVAGIGSLQNRLYVGNAGASKVYGADFDGTLFEVSLPADSGEILHLVSNGERIFVTTNTGLLLGSDVATSNTDQRISTFTPTGTDVTRAVVCNSNISQFTSLSSSGRVVCATSKNATELHITPDFTNAGISVFPLDMNTMKDKGGIPEIGTDSRYGILAAGGYFWLKPNDDRFVRIYTDGSVKTYRDDSGELGKLTFANCATGYDNRTRTIHFTGEDSNGNILDRTFDIDTKSFSFYDGFGIRPFSYATIDAKLYFLKNQSNDLVDAYIPGLFTDDGEDIEFDILTAFTFGKNQKFYKWAFEAFLNFIFAQKEFTPRLSFVDGKIGGEYDEIWGTDIAVTENSSDLGDSYEVLYESAPGELEVDFGAVNFSEYHNPSIKMNRSYYRGGMRLTGTTNNFFHLRGIGIESSPTARQKQQNIYN